MAVEFLDGGSATGQSGSGFEFLDEPARSGVEFLEGESAPIAAAALNQRFKDLNYTPTLAEYKIWQQAQDKRTLTDQAGDFLNSAGEAAGGLLETIWGGIKGVGKMAQDPETNDPLITGVEGLARGVRRDAQLVGHAIGKVLDPDRSIKEAAQQFFNDKLYEWRGATLSGAGTKLPEPSLELRKQWQSEFEQDVLPGVRYRSFIADRVRKQNEAPPPGNLSVITGAEAPFNPEVAETQSLVTSPLALVPMSKALTPVKTAIAAKTLQGAGKTFEWVGDKTVLAGTLPERAAGAAARLVSGSDEAASKATQTVAQGVAGISMAPVKAAGKTITAGGEAASSIGRQAAEGPSRYGLFDRISKDAKAPQWMRRAANAARPLDSSVAAAGIAAKGASEGAAIGTAFGAVADGEEGAAGGFGGGLVLGAGGALVGRALGGTKYRQALEDADVARWLASKSEAEVQNLRNLNLSRDQAVTLADVERLAKGVTEPGKGGDVEFRYVSDKEFSQAFGIGKGAQVLNGDRPVVYVNTGYKGPRSMLHETLHGLDALEGFTPQRQALNRALFDQTLPDGTVVSKGIYSASDLAEFTSQYRGRLNEAARAEFDLLTPEDRQARILSEVRAESFANLGRGRPGPLSLSARGLKQRVADSLLLADQQSMLGKLRRALERAGVKFSASGEPSELFVKNGRPITNTPVIDAALRDYIRAKDNLTRKLVAGDDDAPQFVVTPQDLLSKGNTPLVEVFKDSDIFAKQPDGKVKMMGGVPVLLSEREINQVQSKRVDGMMDALVRVPNAGEADTVTLKENGAWEGRWFSDKQIAAFDALPDDVLSPSMKGKLRELNTLARQDGQQIILDYNAALKNRRYSSGISPTTRAVVPLTFHISKAGNFYMTTLDTTHFFRKLGEWRRSRARAFDAWNGDTDAFLRDAFTYLDNHVNGRPGSVNLDSDPAVAVTKKNVINDFFNVPKGKGNEDLNPVQISKPGDKDNLIRSRRFDRINRITPGAGDRFPVRYELQKRNYLPTGPIKTTNNQLGWINEVWAARYPQEAAWEVAALMKLAPKGGIELVNPGFQNYKAFITRLPKDPEYPYQTTWFYADGVDTIPVGDKAATTYEDAVKTALNAGFTHETLLDKQLRKRYASDYENALTRTETGGAQRLPTQAGSEGGTSQTSRAIPQSGQAQPNARTAAVNFLPTGEPPKTGVASRGVTPNVSPVAIHKQLLAQAHYDLAGKVSAPPGISGWIAQAYLHALDKQLNRRSTDTRIAQLQQLQQVANELNPNEAASLLNALTSGGQKGAQQRMEQLAQLAALKVALSPR